VAHAGIVSLKSKQKRTNDSILNVVNASAWRMKSETDFNTRNFEFSKTFFPFFPQSVQKMLCLCKFIFLLFFCLVLGVLVGTVDFTRNSGSFKIFRGSFFFAAKAV
jgi:hypothetical protein